MTSKMPKEERELNGCVRWKKNVGELGEDGRNIGWSPGVQCLQGEVRLLECRGEAAGKARLGYSVRRISTKNFGVTQS